MNDTTQTSPAWRDRVPYQALLLGTFSLIAAALLAVGDLLTRGPIAERRAEDLKASLSQVLPPQIHDNDLLAHPLTLPGRNGQPLTIYRALHGYQVTGVAFGAVGRGYAGPIELLIGIDAQGRVLGARVLSHSETPGLGDKIEVIRDDWILSFNGRTLEDPPRERWAVAKDGGDFDQFTGATITPRAVVGAVRESLEFFADHRETLTAAAVIIEHDPEEPVPQ
ncbi:electron transport complex subunit RsxG [Thioalkalicoccus limnaeus]|uniref:Ion-translocating oxidoreductase complex subunit G n=1 Tax=Thioalkalicoccus limnaeus TaxID=120681 RepID=A0ABV4BFD8_9GAMM